MKTLYWLNYPAEYTAQLKPLLHQQMWLFGRDILCPGGNLLYQYQFTHTCPKGNGSSMYTRFDHDQQIVLWGWGIWIGRPEMGSVFVNRFKALPRFTAVAPLANTIHQQAGLPHLTHRVTCQKQAQAMRQLWTELLSWLTAYEAWVLEKFGPTWRQAALEPFQHAITPLQDVGRLTHDWRSLAEQSQTLAIESYTP